MRYTDSHRRLLALSALELLGGRIAGGVPVILGGERAATPADKPAGQVVASTVEPKRVIDPNTLNSMHGRPHYSNREMERRQRQIARRQLKAENGLRREPA